MLLQGRTAHIPYSTNSNQNIVPRRYVAPSKRYTDPFVPFVNNTARFPVLPSERRYYSAICHIGKIPEKKRCPFLPHKIACTSSTVLNTQYNVFTLSLLFSQWRRYKIWESLLFMGIASNSWTLWPYWQLPHTLLLSKTVSRQASKCFKKAFLLSLCWGKFQIHFLLLNFYFLYDVYFF
jgi:hypothetical protein